MVESRTPSAVSPSRSGSSSTPRSGCRRRRACGGAAPRRPRAAAHANLARADTAQLGTARGWRAAGGTRQRQGPFLSLLTDRHDHSDPAPDANPGTAVAPATAAPKGTLAIRLAVHARKIG